jgi:sortase A
VTETGAPRRARRARPAGVSMPALIVALIVTVVAAGALVVVLRLTGAPPIEASPVPVTLPTTSTTSAASTTTTSTTTTTSSTTTTVAPTTTLGQQTTWPIAPPPDPRAPENNPPLGRIAIPAIGLDTQLEQGIRLATFDRGPGHWPGSALPGQIGNVVVGGHRTSRGAEFRQLDRLTPGDEVRFTTDAGTHAYVVTGTRIVGPDALWITNPTDTPTATLFACHPLGSTAERIVVDLALAP